MEERDKGSGKRENGAPEEVRTPNLLIRSQVLYPVELRVRFLKVARTYAKPFEYAREKSSFSIVLSENKKEVLNVGKSVFQLQSAHNTAFRISLHRIGCDIQNYIEFRYIKALFCLLWQDNSVFDAIFYKGRAYKIRG